MEKNRNHDGFKNSDGLVEEILNSIGSAVFLLDDSKEVLKYNQAFLDMFSLDCKMSENNCFKSINIGSKVTGVEYIKLRFREEDEGEESRKCVFNHAVNQALNKNQATENRIVGDEYYEDGVPKQLFLKFSVKPLKVGEERYVLVMIDDISEFETTKIDLLKNNIKIKRFNDLYKSELKMASRVQSSILPKKLFKSEDFKIDFRYFPLGEIGGDFFDFFRIDQTHIGVLLCDVAGHGVPSALITTMIKAMLESSKSISISPKNLVKYMNNQIIKIFGDCFVTMIYGVIDTETGIFTYVRAGHPKPWLLRRNSVSTMGLKNNILLGADERTKFEEETIYIEKGSRLILYTDGLIDTGTKNSGYEPEIMELLKKEWRSDTERLINEIEKDIKERLKDGKHQDDICLIVVERLAG